VTGQSSAELLGRRVALAVRVIQVLLGLGSVGFSVIVLADPYTSANSLLALLALALAFTGIEALISGSLHLKFWETFHPSHLRTWISERPLAIVAVSVVTIVLAGILLGVPNLGPDTAVLLLGIALATQGIGRIYYGVSHPIARWLSGSAIASGAVTVFAVGISFFVPGIAFLALALLIAVVLVINGAESIVIGLQPEGERQLLVLKLLFFSALYGLVLINWIDLYPKSVPDYSIWLILTYMAPFGVVIVFQGWDSWPLAVSLGLLVSLFNDVGYFFVGNLLFGFHQNLEPWIVGQLGFRGDRTVTIFRAAGAKYRVASWMMGLSIYLRATVVACVLYYWWTRGPNPLGASGVNRPAGAIQPEQSASAQGDGVELSG
jgi:uncharacterized membrane protein HdeD (DUF308 family)